MKPVRRALALPGSGSGSKPAPRWLANRLLRWFRANARDLPWRRTSDPYAIWVSEIMLQQTQVRTVIPYYARWMELFPSVRDLAVASLPRLLRVWEGLGYYRRARNLHAAAKRIAREHGALFPRDFEDILALPGIGRYTAGAIASIAYNDPRPVVDGNVARVLSRVFLVGPVLKEPTAMRAIWDLAAELVTAAARRTESFPNACGDLNQSLMELGATHCAPRHPQCEECPVRDRCRARAMGVIGEYPAPGRRPETVDSRRVVLAIRHEARWLLRQRSRAERNGGLWEFPSFEVPGGVGAWVRIDLLAGRLPGVRLDPGGPAFTTRQLITNHRIRLEVHLARPLAGSAGEFGPGSRWCSVAELKRLALSAAHRRIANRLAQLVQQPEPFSSG